MIEIIFDLIVDNWFWFLIFGGTVSTMISNAYKEVAKVFKGFSWGFLKKTAGYFRPGHWGIQVGMTWEELCMSTSDPGNRLSNKQLKKKLNKRAYNRWLDRWNVMEQDQYGDWHDREDRMSDTGYSFDELDEAQKDKERKMSYPSHVGKQTTDWEKYRINKVHGGSGKSYDIEAMERDRKAEYDAKEELHYLHSDDPYDHGRYGVDSDNILKTNQLRKSNVEITKPLMEW